MMTVALVLTHDKGDTLNASNASLLETFLNPDPSTPNMYTVTGLNGYQFFIVEIVPLGVTPPSHSLKPMRRVIYGTDQPSTSGQFLNFGLTRGVDYLNADIVIFIEDASKLTRKNLQDSSAKIINNVEFLENELYGKFVTQRWHRTVMEGMGNKLDDKKTQSENLTIYKAKAVEGGLVNG